MKVNFTRAMFASIALASVLSLSAQDAKKVLSFTVSPEAVGKETSFQLSAIDGQSVQVDWGNGSLSDAIKLANYDDAGWVFTELSGTITGETITVYGTAPEAINYFDAAWNQKYSADTKIKTVDVSALSSIKDIMLNSNSLIVLDISKCVKLETLNASINSLEKLVLPEKTEVLKTINVFNTTNGNTGDITAGSNEVLETNWASAPNLQTLNVAGNTKLTTVGFNISENLNLTQLNLTCCFLNEIDITKHAKLKTFNANFNRFTTLDLSTLPAKAYVYANNNNLESVKINSDLGRLQVKNNRLTFKSLPDFKPASASNYMYAPQNPMEATVADGKVDLSYQAIVGTTATVFSWKNGDTDLLEGTDYTVDNGVFTFLKDADKAVCSMTNSNFSNLTLTTVQLNIQSAGIESVDADNNAPVEYYDLRGIKANGDTPGIYIRRQGNKTAKVIVK